MDSTGTSSDARQSWTVHLMHRLDSNGNISYTSQRQERRVLLRPWNVEWAVSQSVFDGHGVLVARRGSREAVGM